MSRGWPPLARLAVKRTLRVAETLCFGPRWCGDMLAWVLRQHNRSLFRREWRWADASPHFENNRSFLYLWYLNSRRGWPLGRNPDFLARGFYNRELLRAHHRLLDIGCGDGFFPYLFYSGVAASVDAVDCEPRAIAAARRYHRAANITYHICDAVREPLPPGPFDLVLWDGAIGHFRPEEINTVMAKIRAVLAPDGILAGSEALEAHDQKSWDHYLAFPEPGDVRRFLERYFQHVQVRETPPVRGRYREAYFRCSDQQDILQAHHWQNGLSRTC